MPELNPETIKQGLEQNTANAYQAYLTNFPDGKYIEDAKAVIAEAARQEAERQKQARCRAWNSQDFFKTASAGDVRTCLRAGADPKARDRSSNTPLHDAAEQGQADAIAALLEGGADPKARDENGKTPFDIIPSDSPLIGTSAYRRLQQAR